MSTNDPRDPRNVPPSPDHLELRGRVGGVTRIGPRAFALALAVIGAIILIVIYGVNKTTGSRTTTETASTANVAASPAPNPFATVPIVATPAPSAEPVPLLEPPTPVPNVEPRQVAAPAAPVAAPANFRSSASDEAARAAQAQRDQQAEQARQDAEKARLARIDAAYRSQILAGSGEQAGSGLGGGGGSSGLGFAGNGAGAPAAQLAAQAAGALGGGNPGFAGSGSTASGLMGRNIPNNVPLGAEPTPDPNAFLAGPVGQYGGRNVAAADVSQTTSALPANGNAEDYLSSGRTAARSAYQLTAGSVIPASLVTGLDSEIAGIVIAQVREDVYDTRTGKYRLIPRGTRLVGVYKSGIAYGTSRVFVAWRRMIFPDTTNVDLENFSGNDQEGYAGFGGTVDNHTGRIIGAALLTSIIGAGFELTQRNTGGTVLQVPSAGQAVGQAVGQQVTQVTTNLIQKQLNIPPVVYVPKGYPFLVVVDRDVVFPGPYRDL